MKSFKVVFLGDSGVGAKTSLISRIICDTFDPNCNSTNGASLFSKEVSTTKGNIILNFWDIPGKKNYREIIEFFYKDAHCIILGYDITSMNSFDSIKTIITLKLKNY